MKKIFYFSQSERESKFADLAIWCGLLYSSRVGWSILFLGEVAVVVVDNSKDKGLSTIPLWNGLRKFHDSMFNSYRKFLQNFFYLFLTVTKWRDVQPILFIEEEERDDSFDTFVCYKIE